LRIGCRIGATHRCSDTDYNGRLTIADHSEEKLPCSERPWRRLL
jgi:hypothetical protein